MTLAKKFIEEFEQLSNDKQQEVIDFVEFLKTKDNKNLDDIMDEIIIQNKEAFEKLAK